VPALSLPALKTQIANRRLAPVYLFVGEDLKLVDRMVDAIESTVDPADRPFAVERVYAGESGGTPLEISASARSMPMLGDRRIVIVLRAERLLKPKRGSKAGATASDDERADPDGGDEQPVDAAPLEEYLAAPVPTATLVFVATAVDRTRRLSKRVIECAAVVEFQGLGRVAAESRGGIQGWLTDQLAVAGRAIERGAARLLVERCGDDISKLRGDVERLLLFAEGRRTITTDDVMAVVTEQFAVTDDWAVTNAIAEGNAARALSETGRRLDRGDSPHQLVGQLRWWVSARLAPSAPGRVKAALEALLRTDLALKSSGGDDRVLLERLVVELTEQPLANLRGGRF
jgi:DNA polymerase-3 subunit delta